jgi:photosystem II stability/assembly factor-like uncharacterized protein
MKAMLRALLALALLAGTARLAWAMPPRPADKVPWYPVALYGGPVFAASVGTEKNGVQLMAVGGEEVFTSERGSTWRAAAARVGRVSSLVAADGGALFASSAGTGEGFRSNDGGRTWNSLRFRGTEPLRFLTASPNFRTDGVAFGITVADWRLYRTDKGTSNWIEVVLTPGVAQQTGAVALSPVVRADETIFAGADTGIYKSTDKGQTWELWSTPTDGAPAFGAKGGPAYSQGLVLPRTYGDDPDSLSDTDVRIVFAYNAQGVYRSDDDGKTWHRLPLDVEMVRGLAVSNAFPTDPVVIAAVQGGGKVAAVSEDGGTTWALVDGPDGVAGTAVAMALDFAKVSKEVDPRIRFIYLPMAMKAADRPAPPGVPRPPEVGSREAILATDGDGVWRTRDGGRTWAREWAGLANVQPAAVAFLPPFGGDSQVLVGTRAAGLYRSLNGGRSYQFLATNLPRGVTQEAAGLALSPDFGQDRTAFLAASSGVWISQDAGVTWRLTAGPVPAKSVAVSPSFAQDRTIVANARISKDAGDTWADLPVVKGPVAFSPTYDADKTLWAGGDQLYKSVDGGQTWQDFKKEPLLNNRPVYAVAALQVVPGEYRVFVGTDRTLLQSFDNGQKWLNSNITSRPVRQITFTVTQQPQGALVVAAGDDGVFWSDSRGVSWQKEPISPKPAYAVSTADDASTILAATPLRVMRYGYGSARAALPLAYR